MTQFLYLVINLENFLEISLMIPLAAPIAIDSLCLNSSFVVESLPVLVEKQQVIIMNLKLYMI